MASPADDTLIAWRSRAGVSGSSRIRTPSAADTALATAGASGVFSTYEARRKADDTQLLARGINSIQLFDDGKRWWIVSIYWQAERPDSQIPAEYLPKAR